MRDIGWSAMVCGIHTRMGARAVPRRNECGREPTESHYGGKEEGCPWLVGSTALSAGTLEEGLVLNPAIATFAPMEEARAELGRVLINYPVMSAFG